ncbi:MAG: hypothetical protein IPK07_18625 [Deltaproteobacteria bacterium]|nr:hypothetical protein [Deltaproteobacteria bacterium]
MTPRRPLLAFLATLAASVGARAATVGPIENLPAAQAIGREAFPVDPIGRTWTYRRPDGTSVERKVLAQWPPYVFKNILVVSPDDLRMRGIQSTSFDLTGHLTFQKGAWLWATAHAWRLSEVDWRYSGPWVGAGTTREEPRLAGDFPLRRAARGRARPFEHGRPWRRSLGHHAATTVFHRVVGPVRAGEERRGHLGPDRTA